MPTKILNVNSDPPPSSLPQAIGRKGLSYITDCPKLGHILYFNKEEKIVIAAVYFSILAEGPPNAVHGNSPLHFKPSRHKIFEVDKGKAMNSFLLDRWLHRGLL